MSVRCVGADVDDSPPPCLAAQVALDIFGHHEGVSARIHGEVAINAGARDQADTVAFDRDGGRIEGVVQGVRVIVDEHVDGAKHRLALVKDQANVRRIAEICFASCHHTALGDDVLDDLIRRLAMHRPVEQDAPYTSLPCFLQCLLAIAAGFTEVGDEHAGPLGRKSTRCRRTDAMVCAGNQNNFAFESRIDHKAATLFTRPSVLASSMRVVYTRAQVQPSGASTGLARVALTGVSEDRHSIPLPIG